MHNLDDILSPCFDNLRKVENVIRTDGIPGIRRNYYAEIWKIITEIDVNEGIKEIELYFGFTESFPYTLPDVYFPDSQVGYLPHIESCGKKLCLLPDGTSYPVCNSYELIRDCLKRSKIVIRQGINEENTNDFLSEINSYWIRKYDGEPETLDTWLIYGNIPTETCELRALYYNQNIQNDGKNATITKGLLLSPNDKETNIELYLKFHNKVDEMAVLFVKSVSVPHKPPYSLTVQDFLNLTTSEDDCKTIERYINTHKGGLIFFPISKNSVGGIYINKIDTTKRGFRNGSLKATDILLKYDKKHQCQQRQYGNLYSESRIAERTAGIEMPKKTFVVAGLGSIGSQLTYFLSGWNNTDFILIDNDNLHSENIGRHLLGFQYINQNKADAVTDYLHSIRPERRIVSHNSTFQDFIKYKSEVLNGGSALFLCTGDIMTERFVIDSIRKGYIKLPLFILWLEPFGIAGHLVYINPMQMPDDFTLYENEANMLYKYNLLAPDEYLNHSDRFTKKDAGCSGEYTLYSGNDVILLLSTLYPHINKLIQQTGKSTCYRWIGNINIAKEKNITLTADISSLTYGKIEELTL